MEGAKTAGHPHIAGQHHSASSQITPFPRPGLIIRLTTDIMRFLIRHRYLVVFICLLLLFASINFGAAKRLGFIVGLTVLGSISTFYKYRIKLSLGVELCTLATVLCGIAYGPIIGMVVGIISCTLSVVLPQMVDATDVFYIVAFAIVGLLSPLMFHVFHLHLMIIAMIAVIIIMVISEPLRLLSGSVELQFMAWLFIVTNLAWNFLIFSWFGQGLLSLMMP